MTIYSMDLVDLFSVLNAQLDSECMKKVKSALIPIDQKIQSLQNQLEMKDEVITQLKHKIGKLERQNWMCELREKEVKDSLLKCSESKEQVREMIPVVERLEKRDCEMNQKCVQMDTLRQENEVIRSQLQLLRHQSSTYIAFKSGCPVAKIFAESDNTCVKLCNTPPDPEKTESVCLKEWQKENASATAKSIKKYGTAVQSISTRLDAQTAIVNQLVRTLNDSQLLSMSLNNVMHKFELAFTPLNTVFNNFIIKLKQLELAAEFQQRVQVWEADCSGDLSAIERQRHYIQVTVLEASSTGELLPKVLEEIDNLATHHEESLRNLEKKYNTFGDTLIMYCHTNPQSDCLRQVADVKDNQIETCVAFALSTLSDLVQEFKTNKEQQTSSSTNAVQSIKALCLQQQQVLRSTGEIMSMMSLDYKALASDLRILKQRALMYADIIKEFCCGAIDLSKQVAAVGFVKQTNLMSCCSFIPLIETCMTDLPETIKKSDLTKLICENIGRESEKLNLARSVQDFTDVRQKSNLKTLKETNEASHGVNPPVKTDRNSQADYRAVDSKHATSVDSDYSVIGTRHQAKEDSTKTLILHLVKENERLVSEKDWCQREFRSVIDKLIHHKDQDNATSARDSRAMSFHQSLGYTKPPTEQTQSPSTFISSIRNILHNIVEDPTTSNQAKKTTDKLVNQIDGAHTHHQQS